MKLRYLNENKKQILRRLLDSIKKYLQNQNQDLLVKGGVSGEP